MPLVQDGHIYTWDEVHQRGVWKTPSGMLTEVSFGAPSVSVKLTAAPGEATTALRSDAQLALDVSIAPTWSGLHTFTLAPVFSALTASRVMVSDGSKKPASSTVTQAALETAFGSQSANLMWAGPTSGGAAAAAFRALVVADIPTLTASKISDFSTAADARITLQKAVANGLATLGSDGKIPSSQLPALAITDTFVVASQAAMLALSAETGDVAVRSDVNKSFILAGTDPTSLAHWQELLTPTDAVLSVNGMTGAVTLTTSHITEGTNLYFTNARARSALSSGNTNRVTYDSATGVISGPQDIHTAATPQFARLGLGVSPSYTLHLGGGATSALALGSNVIAAVHNAAASAGAYVTVKHNTGAEVFLGSDSGTAAGLIGTLSNADLAFRTNNALVMTLTTGGGLGIGTATLGSDKLRVAGSARFDADVLVNAATANLYLKDTSTGFQSASTTVVTLQASNALRSTSFTSGLIGWNISAAGDIEANNLTLRGALRTSVLLYNAVLATSGSQITVKSAAKLRTDFAVPSGPTYGTTVVNIDVVDHDGLSHAASQLFAAGDYLYIKDGLAGATIFKVSSVSDQTSFWRYVCTVEAGTNNVTYRAGLGVLDYGASGGAGILQTADQANAPYLQMFTHAGVTAQNSSGTFSLTPLLRLGNLNGSYGFGSDAYGFGTGQYGAASKTWITVEQTNGLRIGNNTTTLAQWDTSGVITVGQVAASQSNIRITSGAIQLRNNTTVVSAINADGSAHFGTNIAISAGGVLTAGGWTVNSSTITGTSTTIDSAGKLTLGTSNDVVILDAADATYRLVIGHATYASAPFRVTKAGVLTATGATITGTVTATSGAFTGTVEISSATGALAVGTTPPTSASNGTGIWLDRTGLYTLDAGAVGVTVDNNGINITAGTHSSNGIDWISSGSVVGRVSTDRAGVFVGTVLSASNLVASNGTTTASITASDSDALGAVVTCAKFGPTHSTRANSGLIALNFNALVGGAGGVVVGTGVSELSTPGAALDVRGGVLSTSSYKINGGQSWGAGLMHEGSGKVLTYAINAPQLGTRDTTRTGGIFRMDTRTSGEGVSFANGGQSFVIWGYPTGGSVDTTRLIVSLQDGTTALCPSGGSVGVNTTSPNAAALLDLTSTTKGLLLPRMTTTERNNISSPPDGLMIYNTTLSKFQGRAGGAWVDLH